MRVKIKKWISFFLAAVMLLSCAACSRAGEDPYDMIPESTGGKDVTRSAAADNVFSLNSHSRYSFDPLTATNHANQLICSLVYENMVEVDNDFNVIEGSGVISHWTYNDTATLWTFYIEEGHTFHDGTPVTTRDLRYSLDRSIHSDRYSGRFNSYYGASTTDEYLQVSLGKGDTQLIKLMNIPVIKAGTAGTTDPPIGSGPYTFNEDRTALVAYEGYPGYEDLPVDTVYIKEYQAADSIISAFEDAYIDVVINDPSSYTNLGYASSNETHTYATTNMHYVAFNEESALGRFPYFRVAMQYAFDRDYLVELLQGNGVASPIPMYPTARDYPQDLANGLRYDLDVCKSVLENAGIRDYDADDLLEYMSGSPQDIRIKFIVSSDSSAKAGVANRFAEDMASIGITVNVVELTWDDYIEALEKGDFDMYYGEVKLRNNFDLTELFMEHDKKRDEDGLPRLDLNYTGSNDITAQQYINDYLAASDMNRALVYLQLCQYLTGSTGSLITIGFERQQIITHRGVIRGIDANAGNPLYNFQNWVIDLSQDVPVQPDEEE